MSTLPANLPAVSSAKLPEMYSRARQELAECARVDECKGWADKMAAIASYARQAGDEGLEKMARRIRARAIARCGELLREIEPAKGGRPRKDGWACPCGADRNSALAKCRAFDEHWPEGSAPEFTTPGLAEKPMSPPAQVSRSEAARDAGLSHRQKVQALRVAAVPPEEREALIESDAPPTVEALAERGKRPAVKPMVDLHGRDPEDFAASTTAQGAIRLMAEMTATISPAIAARGAMEHERETILAHLKSILKWSERLLGELEMANDAG